MEGLQKRDRMVFDWCQKKAIKVAVTMGGGYAPEVEDIVQIHLQTVTEAIRFGREFQALSFSRS